MKKILLATALAGLISTSAFAADMAVKAPMYTKAPVTPAYNWTGFYAGFHGGYAWGDVDVTNVPPATVLGTYSYKPNGGFGGGQIGANYQIGSFLIGVEGEGGYLGLSGSGIAPSSAAGQHQDLTLKNGGYGDITGRLGVVFGPALFYGKGGYAVFGGRANEVTTNPGYAPTATGTFSGWTAGGGVEYMFASNWSAKIEYLHFDFGTQNASQISVSAPPVGVVYPDSNRLKADSVKVGFNYHL